MRQTQRLALSNYVAANDRLRRAITEYRAMSKLDRSPEANALNDALDKSASTEAAVIVICGLRTPCQKTTQQS